VISKNNPYEVALPRRVEARPGHPLLGEQFAERKALIEKLVPAASRPSTDKSSKTCDALALPPAPCNLARKPRLRSSDHNGKHITSAELLSRGRLILCFIRGRWTRSAAASSRP